MIRLLSVTAATIFLAACSNPAPTWYKGNLHTHSLWSDGDDFPESVIAWYGDRDYDFVALSDHNTMADVERWIRIDSTRRPVFERYAERFGAETRQRGDTRVQELLTYTGLQWQFSDDFGMETRVGAVLAGDYKLEDGDAGTPRVDGQMDPSFFFDVSFGILF